MDEKLITQSIIEAYFDSLKKALDLDVAIVGAGPSGLLAGCRLAREGFNVAIFERKLSVGGGMWGGGMTFNYIVVQDEAKRILDELGIPSEERIKGYHTADAVLAVTALAYRAALGGVKIFNCISVEDVVIKDQSGEGIKKICGIVVNSSPVVSAGLHVDPIVFNCRYLIESTGHDLEVLTKLTHKNDVRLNTPSGKIEGERSMWAEVAERDTMENTREIFPGLYVAGMAANAAFGSYRMGPIFGGMLLSAEKVAAEITARLREKK